MLSITHTNILDKYYYGDIRLNKYVIHTGKINRVSCIFYITLCHMNKRTNLTTHILIQEQMFPYIKRNNYKYIMNLIFYLSPLHLTICIVYFLVCQTPFNEVHTLPLFLVSFHPLFIPCFNDISYTCALSLWTSTLKFLIHDV